MLVFASGSPGSGIPILLGSLESSLWCMLCFSFHMSKSQQSGTELNGIRTNMKWENESVRVSLTSMEKRMAGIQIALAPFIPTHSIVHLSMRRVCSVHVESPGIGNGFLSLHHFRFTHPVGPVSGCVPGTAGDSRWLLWMELFLPFKYTFFLVP